eukprot:Rmarinus@m.18774
MLTTTILLALLAVGSALQADHPFTFVARDGHVEKLSFNFDAYYNIKELLTPKETLVFPKFMLSHADHLSVDLDLHLVEIFTDDVSITARNGDVVEILKRPDQLLLSGSVRFEDSNGVMHPIDESSVFLALSPFGSNGYFQYEDHTYILSTPPEALTGDGAPESLLFDAASVPIGGSQPEINKPLLIPESLEEQAQSLRENPPAVRSGSTVVVALEGDYAYYKTMGYNDDAAVNYMSQLLSATSSIYQRDIGHYINLSYLRLWKSADPYAPNSDSSSETLDKFQNYWNTYNDGLRRDTAHLISGKSMGGLAYLSGLCYPNFGYGVCGSISGSFPTPVQDYHKDNWDLVVLAHELGHNFGSEHTHDYDPPIDQCMSGVCQKSTLMSYCHLCSTDGLKNIALKFHTRVQDRMEQFLHYESRCGFDFEENEFDHVAIAA